MKSCWPLIIGSQLRQGSEQPLVGAGSSLQSGIASGVVTLCCTDRFYMQSRSVPNYRVEQQRVESHCLEACRHGLAWFDAWMTSMTPLLTCWTVPPTIPKKGIVTACWWSRT